MVTIRNGAAEAAPHFLFILAEQFLPHFTQRSPETTRNSLLFGAGKNAAVQVAFLLIINPSADITDIFH